MNKLFKVLFFLLINIIFILLYVYSNFLSEIGMIDKPLSEDISFLSFIIIPILAYYAICILKKGIEKLKITNPDFKFKLNRNTLKLNIPLDNKDTLSVLISLLLIGFLLPKFIMNINIYNLIILAFNIAFIFNHKKFKFTGEDLFLIAMVICFMLLVSLVGYSVFNALKLNSWRDSMIEGAIASEYALFLIPPVVLVIVYIIMAIFDKENRENKVEEVKNKKKLADKNEVHYEQKNI